MTNVLSPSPVQRFYENNGAPLASGRVFTYAAGTSNKLTTYKTPSGGDNDNPIVLNARGECDLWIPPNVSYKYVIAPPGVDDPPSTVIDTIDNVVSSQLITLYGGVDTGAVNAYLLTFVANFSAYTDGIVIYWIPSNTNSGPSTINVNGIGVVPIVNGAGSPLVASQIVQNQPTTIIYKGGSFILVPTGQLGDGSLGPVIYGSWTPTWAGFGVSPPTGTANWVKIGRLVVITFNALCTGTSNATSFAITNVPGSILGITSTDPIIPVFPCIDNGAAAIATGRFTIPSGKLEFWKGATPNAAGWTAAGAKGFETGSAIVYST